jgi:glycosyltransferase involved in cell wall biosynthesis
MVPVGRGEVTLEAPRKSVLFLSRWYPYPPDNGARIRVYHLLKELSVTCQIDLLSFATREVEENWLNAMGEVCRRVKVVPYRHFQPNSLRAMFGLFSPKPRSVVDTFNDEMAQAVDAWLADGEPDLVIASEIDMAPYALACRGIPKLLEELEVGWRYRSTHEEIGRLARLRSWMSTVKAESYVRRILGQFDACTVVSEPERERLRQIDPNYGRIFVVPNGVDVSEIKISSGEPEPGTIVYAGALTYAANLDAMQYFVGEVFPRIRSLHTQAHLRITGNHQGVKLSSISNTNGVELTGYLPDVRSTIADSRVSVVPLRIGGGTRLKILESLALGTPVVATSKGAEGLDLVPSKEILLADTPESFAKAVLAVLEDDAIWSSLRHDGRMAVERGYSWSEIGSRLRHVVEHVSIGSVPQDGLEGGRDA